MGIATREVGETKGCSKCQILAQLLECAEIDIK